MAYHETPAGAKIFAAGALDFGGSALEAPVTKPVDAQLSRRRGRDASARAPGRDARALRPVRILILLGGHRRGDLPRAPPS
jgi:hypothetical protein